MVLSGSKFSSRFQPMGGDLIGVHFAVRGKGDLREPATVDEFQACLYQLLSWHSHDFYGVVFPMGDGILEGNHV